MFYCKENKIHKQNHGSTDNFFFNLLSVEWLNYLKGDNSRKLNKQSLLRQMQINTKIHSKKCLLLAEFSKELLIVTKYTFIPIKTTHSKNKSYKKIEMMSFNKP